jgi:hypothetical protein
MGGVILMTWSLRDALSKELVFAASASVGVPVATQAIIPVGLPASSLVVYTRVESLDAYRRDFGSRRTKTVVLVKLEWVIFVVLRCLPPLVVARKSSHSQAELLDVCPAHCCLRMWGETKA